LKNNGLFLILGNQLFNPSLLRSAVAEQEPKSHSRAASGSGSSNDTKHKFSVFMKEDLELCTYYRFHKHKIAFFLTAMRDYRDELKKSGFEVEYAELSEASRSEKLAKSSSKNSTPKQRSDSLPSYEQHLEKYILSNKVSRIYHFEIEDKFFELRLKALFTKLKLDVVELASPLFLTSRAEFATYLKGSKKPFMKTFYQRQRLRTQVLLDNEGEPLGGKWSYDAENRLPLPAKIQPPELAAAKTSKNLPLVLKLVDQLFFDHPGETKEFWLPTTRPEALKWFQLFLETRLKDFGPYEDALPLHSDFAYHSVISPLLNVGLISPVDIMTQVQSEFKKRKLPIESVEGFIRQILGWREFVRGIYQNFSKTQETTNFWKHDRRLSKIWYDGRSTIPPLDHTISKVQRYGYAHHIERLMVVGSLMMLLEVDPQDAHRWFMEMFVDSSDWVMGPNVYGMALMSDGGLFATKPYICGSNYYRKMGPYKKGPWCDGVDGLYWGFVEKHKNYYKKNPRVSFMVSTVEKMDPARKKLIYTEADRLRELLTC
jgi:deoxyribodipyrimidine photolyase-related protein